MDTVYRDFFVELSAARCTFLTSDHHFGHRNVIKHCERPFFDIEEMGEALVAAWNEQVQPLDTVIYVGDFSLSVHAVEKYLPRLNGIKHLVVGNHDWAHQIHKGWRKKRQRYLAAGWASISDEATIHLRRGCFGVHRYHVAHLPYRHEGMSWVRANLLRLGQKLGLCRHAPDDRYSDLRPIPVPGHFVGLICGHVHGAWLQRGNMFNVGVDASRRFRLWTLDDVAHALSCDTNRKAKSWSGRP